MLTLKENEIISATGVVTAVGTSWVIVELDSGEYKEDTRTVKGEDPGSTVMPDVYSPDLKVGDYVDVDFMYSETVPDGRTYMVEATFNGMMHYTDPNIGHRSGPNL